MKNLLLIILLSSNTLFSQTTLSQTSGNQIDFLKSNFKDLKDGDGNNIFDANGKENYILMGESPDTHFGFSVSDAGDVNNDGYDDVIIGAYYYIGRAYIFYGGSNFDNIADLTFTENNMNAQFGISVSSAGDVNDDGYSDVIIGEYNYFDLKGRAYIYFGGIDMDTIPDVIMTGQSIPNIPNHFGYSVSSAGDFNNDGYSDVIVGAFGYNGYRGAAYIFYGGITMNNVPDVTMIGEQSSSAFGFSVSNAGDVNNDGFSDVVIGAFEYDLSGNHDNGRAYIYFGSSSMNNVADVIMTGESTLYKLGNSVSSAGDVNNDGFTDVIVGAHGYSEFTGRAYVYYGGSSMNNVADVIMTGEDLSNNFGFSVSTAGDVNADGFSDVIIGATGYDSIRGRAYIFFGGTPMNNVADLTMTGNALDDVFGIAVSFAGDVNGDGLSDIAVGASGYNNFKGRAYLFTKVNPISLNIKLLFEGMYSSSFNQLIRKDTISVYLRQASPPFNVIDSAIGVIDSLSFSNLFNFYDAQTGTFYIVTNHLNSIESWSKTGGETLTADGQTYYYDFTSTVTQAYGNNLKLKGSKYCLYSGDVNQDGFIDLLDVVPIYNDATNFITGNYLPTDLTGDGIVDLTDVTLCYNNSSNFIRVRQP